MTTQPAAIADVDRELKRLVFERRAAEGVPWIKLSERIDELLDQRRKLDR